MVLIKKGLSREAKRRIEKARGNLQREVDNVQRMHRESLDAKLKADTEYQTARHMSSGDRARAAVNRLAKEIKDFNEKANIKDGESFKAAGDSFEKAKEYAADRARINDLRE